MTAEDTGLHQAIKLTNFSSLNRLLAVTAYVYEYVNNLHKSQPKLTGPLTMAELSCAQRRWVQNCQENTSSGEMSSVRSKSKRPEVSKPPLFRQLRCFIDNAGLLHCGRRIHKAPLSELSQFDCTDCSRHPRSPFPCRCWIYLESTQAIFLGATRTSIHQETIASLRSLQEARGQAILSFRVSITPKNQSTRCTTVYCDRS